jgi:hypothetical protein
MLGQGRASHPEKNEDRAMAKAAKKSAEPTVVEVDAAKWLGKLKVIGGSQNDDWNNILANQAVSALWLKNTDIDEAKKQRFATVAALLGIAPRDEIEGMLATQLVACHNASMECYRRAMLGEQTFEGRRENLNQANKLSRTYATLLETLNRHRGKGAQQKVIVEHVNVAAGGQAIVGNVEAPGGGVTTKREEQPHALAYAPGTPLPSTDPTREPVSITGDAERSMPDARRNVTGRTEGK